MKKTILTLLVIAYAFISQAQRNVILIIADDVGTDYLGFYEDHAADTVSLPNISTLLSKGVRFQNAMSNPLCSATRSGIFTGRYSFRRVGGLSVGAGYVDTSEVTIPRLLNIYDSNIAKAQIGKFHLQVPPPNYGLQNPNGMGYDYYSGCLDGGLPSYFNWTKTTNGVNSNITNYATVETANDAISWIQSQANKPFFLWLAFNAPHVPYHLPAPGLYSDTTLSGTQADINAHTKKYFKATLEALDHEIGRLFDSLRVLNKLDSTDFIFIGDNGNSEKTAQIANTSRSKGTIYQYGVHVPLIISGPSIINPGRVSSALVNTADLFSTILELIGDNTWQSQIPVNKPVDCKSLMPILLNTTDSVRPWAFTEIFQGVCDSLCGKAMRNKDYKLLNFDYGQQEFYNLTVDPTESNDLLTGALSPDEMANYNYLCTEMNNLTGTSNYCNAVNINPTIAITASSTTICAGTSVSFNATVTNGGVSPTYQWKKNGNNVGTNSSSYSANSLTNGNVITCLVTTSASTSAISNPITMAVSTSVPAKPGVISGPQFNLCNSTNQTYTISIVNKAITYNWTVPANSTIVSGQGTTSIVVSYSSLFKSGAIVVQSSNYCGSSANRTKNVYAKTTAPLAITGPNSVCANQQNVSYSIAPVVGATSYTWALPTGSSITSGKGTTSIIAKFGINAGNITVFAKNACASSTKSILPIVINCRMNSEENYDQKGLNTINPFTDKIVFSVNSDISNATVSLFDLTGREICIWKNVSLPADEQQNLSIDKNVPVGIYLLKIKTSKISLVSKINHL